MDRNLIVRPRSHLGRRESRVYAESGNADVDYLSDGMTESLISSLSQLSNLNVKARSSVFRYKGREYLFNPKLRVAISPGKFDRWAAKFISASTKTDTT